MSDNNDPNDPAPGQQGGQGGQTPQGGQPPQGGQQSGGQAPPQGGQAAQGGQAPPQGGQQPQGQAAGGQAYGQAGQQPYAQGPGLTDKLQRPAVKSRIIGVASVHALLGAGVFLTLLILPNLFSSGSTAAGASSVSFGFAAVGFGGGLLLAVILGREISSLNEDANTVLAASFAGNGVGYFVGGILSAFGVVAGPGTVFGGGFGGGPGLVDYIIPLFIAMFFVGAVGAATTYVEQNF